MYKLRELERQDILKINEWRNKIELINLLGAPFRYINPEIDVRWYENYLNQRSTTIRCSIVEEECDTNIVGLVSLTNINLINQSAIFHIMLGDFNNHGKGIGYFATTEILSHAFNNLNLRRIELTVLENNIRAIKLYEKVGFQIEGTLREAVFKNGRFEDMLIMGLLKQEFNRDKIR